MADRTKGPWYADESGNVFTSPDRKSQRRLVANCGGYYVSSDRTGIVSAENLANAVFIAAAPQTAEQRDELLAVCVLCLTLLSENEFADSQAENEADAIRAELNIAIANVERKEGE